MTKIKPITILEYMQKHFPNSLILSNGELIGDGCPTDYISSCYDECHVEDKPSCKHCWKAKCKN